MSATHRIAIEILRSLGACDGPGEAIPWVLDQPDQTPEVLWRTCPRGDWLLWLAHKLGVDWRLVVLAACDCVRPVLHLVPEDDARPRIAIETAEAWTRGEATLEEVRAAADDAYDAAYAYAAANAANAAHHAAYAAYAVANATYDAAYAADYASAVSIRQNARSASLRRSADLVRARIPWELIKAKAWPEMQR